jgi:DnaJ-class molecular chaperone
VQQDIQKRKILLSFQILDLKPTSSWKKIKYAYKIQAKKWHPDRNSDVTAHERTLKLNEAYDFLGQFFDQYGRLNDPSGLILDLTTNGASSTKTNRRGEVKKRLIRFYHGGLAQEERRKDRKIETILIHLNFWFSISNLMLLPPVLAICMGWNGILLALTSNVLFILFTMSAVRNLHRIKFLRLKMKNV